MKRVALASLFAVTALGCAPELDRPSKLETLRVLAVQKSAPYAEPGEKVEMRMLWHDGSKKAPRPVQIAWFSACFNPPGDLYQGCFEQFAQASGGLPPGSQIGLGDRFTFTMPDDVISSRPPPADPKQPHYGLAYVFFAACAGKLAGAASGDSAAFPIACNGPDGKPLGADDFVVGYSAVYAFEGYRNQNAVINGFRVAGAETTPTCIGEDCLGATPPSADCDHMPCISSCPDDGDESCPDIDIKPLIDPSSAEVDQISVDAYGKEYEEQMWVRYFVTAGGVKSDVRLLNDARKGWNGDYGTKLWAPKATGPMTVWAVAHDNRGGVNWVRQDVLVQ